MEGYCHNHIKWQKKCLAKLFGQNGVCKIIISTWETNNRTVSIWDIINIYNQGTSWCFRNLKTYIFNSKKSPATQATAESVCIHYFIFIAYSVFPSTFFDFIDLSSVMLRFTLAKDLDPNILQLAYDQHRWISWCRIILRCRNLSCFHSIAKLSLILTEPGLWLQFLKFTLSTLFLCIKVTGVWRNNTQSLSVISYNGWLKYGLFFFSPFL